MSTEDVDTARKKLDEDIASLEASTRTLKSRRNALSPICRVPPIILYQVFEFLAPTDINTLILNGWHQHLRWIKITHVCRHLRVVALNCPRLWTVIDFNDQPECIAEMLRRSQSALLSVVYWPKSSTFLKSLQEFLLRTERIAELSLRSNEIHITQYLDCLRVLPKPHLHALHLRSSGKFDMPNDLFTFMPHLRSLELVNGRVELAQLVAHRVPASLQSFCLISLTHWDSPSFVILAVLYLDMWDNATSRITLNQLLQILRQMPHLRSISLAHSFTDEADDDVSLCRQQRIKLPHLTNLDLHSYWKYTILFDILSCPKLCTATFRYTPLSRSETDYSGLLSLCSILGQGVRPCLELEVVSKSTWHYFFLHAYGERPAHAQDCSPALELVVEGDDFQPKHVTVKRFIECFALHRLRHVSILGLNFREVDWIRFFGKSSQLESIKVDDLEVLVAILTRRNDTYVSSIDSLTFYFPNLIRANLDATYGKKPVISGGSLERLISCLRARQELGTSIKYLCLTSCLIEEIDVARLREYVQLDLSWGDSGDSDEDDDVGDDDYEDNEDVEDEIEDEDEDLA